MPSESCYWALWTSVWVHLLCSPYQVSIHFQKILLCIFSRPNRPSCLSHFWCQICSHALKIFMALCRNPPTVSMSLLSLSLRAQTWTQHCRSVSLVQNRGEASPPLTCWYFSWFSPEGIWLSLLQRAQCGLFFSLVSLRTTRSFSAKLLFTQQAPTCTGVWGYSSPGGGFGISLSSSFWDSYQANSSVFQGPSEFRTIFYSSEKLCIRYYIGIW